MAKRVKRVSSYDEAEKSLLFNYLENRKTNRKKKCSEHRMWFIFVDTFFFFKTFFVMIKISDLRANVRENSFRSFRNTFLIFY